MTYLSLCWLNLEIGHINLFVSLGIAHSYGPQKVLQAMGIVFPCQPLSRKVWLEIPFVLGLGD